MTRKKRNGFLEATRLNKLKHREELLHLAISNYENSVYFPIAALNSSLIGVCVCARARVWNAMTARILKIQISSMFKGRFIAFALKSVFIPDVKWISCDTRFDVLPISPPPPPPSPKYTTD